MKVADDLTQLIGNTPLVRLNKLNTGNANVYVKLEYFNPANSIKDRAAYQMLDNAIKSGLVDDNTTIIEPTSGNTGIGLAMICAIKNLKIILTMPESMSLERRKLLKAYGAELVLTPASEGMQGAVNKAIELHNNIKNSYIPSQFDNPSNPRAHYLNTAEEIWNDTDGCVDILVAGVGTGGTISGIAKKLKQKKSKIKIIAVEPYSSQVLAGKGAGAHKIQGIGANFKPKNYVEELVDEVVPVKNEDAIKTARLLGTREGILSGFSGGANVYASIEISKRIENKGKTIVTVLPDCGERYLSSELYSDC